MDDAGHRGPHEHALVEEEVDLEAGRQTGQDLRHQLARPVDDRQRGGAAVRQDRQQRRVAAVTPHEVRLRIEPVVHERDIGDGHHGAVRVPDGDPVQLTQDLGAAVDGDVVLARADLRRARRQDDVLGQERIADILGGEPPRVERVRVDVDVDDAHLAAVGHRDGCALNGDELGADEVVAQVVELLLGQLIAAQARQENGDAGGVVLDDERREDARREHAHDLLRLGVHLGDRRLDRHIGMEVEPGDGDAPE